MAQPYDPGSAFTSTSSFDPRRVHPVFGRPIPHQGQDFSAPQGTDIPAAGDGTVAFSGWVNGYGWTVVLEHFNEFGQVIGYTLYAHLNDPGVPAGTFVPQGEPIGKVGSTGTATGSNLHYEVRPTDPDAPTPPWYKATPVDPIANPLGIYNGPWVEWSPLEPLMLFGPGDGILAALEGFHRLFQQATTTQYVDRSPIVLDLDGNGVQTTAVNTGAFFDHDANGFAESTGWVNPNDGFLVLDRNGDGRIDSGRELFGNETLLASGEKAANGFAALAELDSNGDDVIDTNDSAFASLKVWKDTDGDGFSLPSELLSLEEAGVRSINVGYSNSSFVDANGNQHRQIGSFTRTDGSVGAAEDVWFQRDTMNTIAEEWIAVPADIAALPDLRGYGNMYDLHQAMVRDTSGQLEALVQGFIGENDVPARNALFEQILFKWAGVDTIDPLSRNGIDGFHIDARQLGVLEKFFGEQFVGIYGPNPMYDSGLLLKASYQGLFEMMYAELMAQTHLKSEYDAITYRFDTQSQSLKGDISPAFAVLGAEYAANPSAAIADAQDFERSIYALQEVAMFDIDSRLRGTDGNDLIVSSAQGRNDTIDGGAGNDTIIDAGGNNVIDGGDGSDSIALAALSSNVVRGGAGDDVISVASYSSPYWIRQGIEFNFGCNTITGGTGNDTLIGGAELDTYVFNRSDGQDSILDNSVYQQTGWWWGGVTSVDSGLTDTLQFGAEVNASDLSVHLSGDDLVLTINDPSNPNPDPAAVDQITIRNWALGSNYWIENVQFADGTTLHSADLNAIAETGTEGNDVLTGFLGLGLTYRGLGGDDTINAQGGNDTIYGGDGNDTITDLGGSNYIDGGGGDDTIAAQSGNDTIYGGEGNDTITDSGGANFIDGGAGDDTVVVSGSSLGNNTLLGGDGSDVLSLGQVDRYAEASYSNTFEGGRGNDHPTGSSGSDTYVFNRGDGQDTISDFSGWYYLWYWGTWTDSGRSDSLQLGAGITPGDLQATRSGYDLVLTIDDPANPDPDPAAVDRVTVQNWYASGMNRIEQLQFADGTLWDANTLTTLGLEVHGTAGADTLVGLDGYDDRLYGEAGDDTLTGGTGDDLLNGGEGNDLLEGGAGSNTRIGGAGDDTVVVSGSSLGNNTLLGGDGSDVLSLGQVDRYAEASYSNTFEGGRGNDHLTGSSGSDTYVFNRGDGQDTISDFSGWYYLWYWGTWTDSGRSDSLQLGAGITPGDLQATRSGYDLVLTIDDPANPDPDPAAVDRVTVQNWYASGMNRIEQLQFADGTTLGTSDIQLDTSGADLLSGTPADSMLFAGAGNDVLQGGAGNDLVSDTSGNNLLDGGAGNDWLSGGSGNDLLIGRTGNDVIKGGTGTEVIAEAMAGFDANSADPLLNKKVQTFDFTQLVNAFDAARAADPGLTSWALTNALTQYHLSGSDDAALGGDLAYQYGLNGTLA